MSKSLIPQPVSADRVLGRLERSLARQGETVRCVPTDTEGSGRARYYRQRSDGWVRIAAPGAPGEYPLGSLDRRLLGLPPIQ